MKTPRIRLQAATVAEIAQAVDVIQDAGWCEVTAHFLDIAPRRHRAARGGHQASVIELEHSGGFIEVVNLSDPRRLTSIRIHIDGKGITLFEREDRPFLSYRAAAAN